MSDLIDDPQPGQNLPEYSVSEVSGAVKRTLEDSFGRIRVRGEVGRVFRARSGHLYYDVKDERNVLACTTWKGQVASLSVVPEEGLEVIVTGRLTAYGAQSKYNLNVDEVAVAGQGALMALLEKRKKALEKEGLFEASRKKALPFLPETIGVVTSPSGAVIRDILHRLRDRFPRKVLIWPVAVQGAACAPEVAHAIEGFNALTPGGALPRPDLLIVARGGGSVEDLWGFNEEVVARAAAASVIPLISAVGHETDTTLIDFVSDKRAPTPTAAAELAVPVRLELLSWVDGQGARLTRGVTQALSQRRQRVTDLARALPRRETLLDTARQRLDRITERLDAAQQRIIDQRRASLVNAAAGLRPQALQTLVKGRQDQLSRAAARLEPALRRSTTRVRKDLDQLRARLSPAPLLRQLRRNRETFGATSYQLSQTARTQIERWTRHLDAIDRLRETLSYKATLARGYAVVRAEGQVVTTRKMAAGHAVLEIEFSDGRLTAGASGARPARTKRETPPEQGSLL